MAASARNPVTSLMMSAPASSAVRLRTHRADHRQHAAQFLGLIDRFGTRAGGFTADVEDVRAFPQKHECVLDGAAVVVEAAAVGKTVGRDIDDAHDDAAMGEIEVVVAEPPAEHAPRWREFAFVQRENWRWPQSRFRVRDEVQPYRAAAHPPRPRRRGRAAFDGIEAGDSGDKGGDG